MKYSIYWYPGKNRTISGKIIENSWIRFWNLARNPV